ncbi:MAG: hypothetical protein CMF74_17575 [Maricaulis sp.]|jgi:hypothetical protein|nr:hypothetical protein [Maricaulis sp.]MAL11458.1 hypothetical protein [Maricaulis sp.]
MTRAPLTALIAATIVSAAAFSQSDPGFAASPEDEAAIAVFDAARLPDLSDTPSAGEVFGYAGTAVFYYVAGHETAGGTLIAIDRVCDPDPVAPGRGSCDWQYRHSALQAPLTDPALVRPVTGHDIFTRLGRDCPAISETLGTLRIGPDPEAYEVWMGSSPQADLYDRQYRRLEFSLGPAFQPTGLVLIEGRENALLRNLSATLHRPLRECGAE